MRRHYRRMMFGVAVALALLPARALLAASPLSGAWQCRGDDGHHTLTFKSDSTLIFDGDASSYSIMANMILVQEEDGVSTYYYQLRGNKLAIQFPDGSRLDCARGSAKPKQAPATTPPAGKVNNATLAKQIAGTWWGYAGSTERKLGLCPDGSYLDYTESSYSGRSHDSGGNETLNWGTAGARGNRGRWSIQGDYQRGTIQVQTSGGNSFQINYRQVGEPGCLDFNGARLCRTSARCE